MDGIEAAARITAEFDLPIVFLTGHAEPEYIERAQSTEACGYIVKPVHKQNLRPAIMTALSIHELKTRLRTALQEKELLLKEIHHRVKNNLAVMSSLLNIQANSSQDPGVVSALHDSQSRLRALAMVHEVLYQSASPKEIEIEGYLGRLIETLIQAYGQAGSPIRFLVQAPELTLSAEQAGPLGLVINELVTNSLKYAFPDRRPGQIAIRARLTAPNGVHITVSDDGIGFPPDLDWRGVQSMGLKIVVNLVEGQLEGRIDLERRNGAAFTICFDKS